MCSPNRCQFYRNVCLSRSPLYVFIEQIPIFQEDFFSYRTDTNFPLRFVCSSNRYHFSRSPFYVFTEQRPIFQEPLFWLSKRYRFSRSTFLASKQIQIFQEHFFGYRTDADFPGSFFEYQRTDRQFPGRYPLQTDISALGLGGCFRNEHYL